MVLPDVFMIHINHKKVKSTKITEYDNFPRILFNYNQYLQYMFGFLFKLFGLVVADVPQHYT